MFLVLAVTLIFHKEVSSFYPFDDKWEPFGKLCFPQDSCLPTRSDDEDHMWGNYTCECGSHCLRYDTCCSTSPYIGKKMSTVYRGGNCKNFPPFFHEHVIAVSRCSDKWLTTNFQTQSKCENSNGNLKDPLSRVPVTNWKTRVTYSNYFCALCNNDAKEVSFWDTAVQLETAEGPQKVSAATKDYILKNLMYNKDKKSWGVTMYNTFHEVNIQFKIPSHLRKFVKKCHPNMVMQCDPSFSNNRELNYKCLSYFAPVRIQKNTEPPRTYRNIHCAVCNNVDLTDTDGSICKFDADVPEFLAPI